ncbi:MAG: YggT family protein [Acidimicrobiales bacterium]
MAIVRFVLQAYLLLLFVRIVLSWFPISEGSPVAGIYRALYAVTEPVLAPLRRVLPPVQLGGVALDLSPIIVVLVISILLNAL